MIHLNARGFWCAGRPAIFFFCCPSGCVHNGTNTSGGATRSQRWRQFSFGQASPPSQSREKIPPQPAEHCSFCWMLSARMPHSAVGKSALAIQVFVNATEGRWWGRSFESLRGFTNDWMTYAKAGTKSSLPQTPSRCPWWSPNELKCPQWQTMGTTSKSISWTRTRQGTHKLRKIDRTCKGRRTHH